ncbi:hypothetical protein A1O7_08398 [Cladophialophora yegresii CBS 114405]|uniref:Uncharacterized protein n=1 Tax=Cladophialophora yegresii CBS 114405 TaxID=1182544 RepID=W9VTI4_9EURO|nr:uncharacterized protein A1O7_08398 [Cladophialophora yegresii CBS 114405]EXJ55471.1 hypothetical protein A1O7_08398 [Cladophialophora yegresii CBS 114405]
MLSAANGGYVGVDLDELGPESVGTRANRSNYLSATSSLNHHVRTRTGKVTSEISSCLQQVLSREFWQQAIPRSKAFFREAFSDLKAVYQAGCKTLACVRWRHIAWRFITLVCPLLFIVITAAILPIISSPSLYQVRDACRPDSGFYVGFQDYDIWELSGLFQITLGFGNFSFSTAKIIDVGWDIILGRGGQALLAAIAFAVYSKALVRSMESSPVSYGTFEAVTLQSGSLTANFKLARDLLKNKTAQARAAVVWMITSACFVLAFPTILSAMTGYSVNIGSFVQVDDGNLVQYSNFTLIRYIVHDAHRIDQTLGKDYKVTTGRTPYGDISQLGESSYSDYCTSTAWPHEDMHGALDWGYTARVPMCDFYWHVSEYAYHYGFLGEVQAGTTFNYSGRLVNLTTPSLTITPIFWKQDWISVESSNGSDWWYWPFGYYWKSADGDEPFHNFTDPIFTNGEYTYKLDELNVRGRCQPAGQSYKWGFSFLALFSSLIVFLVWCVGMYALWLDAFLHSRFDRVGRSMGLQRAVLDLAYCMQRDVDEAGRDMLSNAELHSSIRQDLKGGRITYEMLEPKLLPLCRAAEWRLKWRLAWRGKWRESSRDWLLRRNKWLCGLFVGSFGFLVAALAGAPVPLSTAMLLAFGSGVVVSTDEGHKSRWLFFLLCLILAVGLAPIGPYT